MVLITGGIDLSVASVASLTGMIIAYGYERMGISPVVTMLFSIVVGVGLGTLMGAAIHYLNVPPFITTLTGNFLARGVCSLISRESISIDHPLLNSLSDIKITLYHLVDGEWVKIKPITNISLPVMMFIAMIVIGTIVTFVYYFGVSPDSTMAFKALIIAVIIVLQSEPVRNWMAKRSQARAMVKGGVAK